MVNNELETIICGPVQNSLQIATIYFGHVWRAKPQPWLTFGAKMHKDERSQGMSVEGRRKASKGGPVERERGSGKACITLV